MTEIDVHHWKSFLASDIVIPPFFCTNSTDKVKSAKFPSPRIPSILQPRNVSVRHEILTVKFITVVEFSHYLNMWMMFKISVRVQGEVNLITLD